MHNTVVIYASDIIEQIVLFIDEIKFHSSYFIINQVQDQDQIIDFSLLYYYSYFIMFYLYRIIELYELYEFYIIRLI